MSSAVDAVYVWKHVLHLLLLLLLLQWDAEVRDKALGLVEDFARGLPHPAYKEAYESLVVSSSSSSSSSGNQTHKNSKRHMRASKSSRTVAAAAGDTSSQQDWLQQQAQGTLESA
jgi:hypothetical protein